jgi:ketosteroid isomerase-like protein
VITVASAGPNQVCAKPWANPLVHLTRSRVTTPRYAFEEVTKQVRRGVESTCITKETSMTIAFDLLQRHIQTLIDDHEQWQTLIADDMVWELAYAPAIGHPARLSGREEVMHHVTWFLGAVENFRFFDVRLYAFADPEGAVAEVKAEGLIKPTGRIYRQDYVVFLRAVGGKIVFLREYFDPVRAAKALDTPILGLES